MSYEIFLTQKLRLLFPDEIHRREASAILDRYGSEDHEWESSRVKLAILKLSGADLEEMRHATELARQDYRDVLAWAEYPRQIRQGPMPEGPEKQRLVEADRAEYEAWLRT